ncbi:sulfite reductase subunit alpha [Cellvibrio japonicus]|uniref:sulfite reductase subunit alpha n=1 Tax=Cellvibrio japonicus TaxID=155077 RepID=UPI0013051616|nr:sulfite reductase subunit alpha [Cellvibrio japonicus]
MILPPIHSLVSAFALLLVYSAFCVFVWRHYRRQQTTSVIATSGSNGKVILLGYASQGGNALRIAQQTAAQLQQAGRRVELLPLNRLDAERLQQATLCLLVLSTYGEGEPPDNANRFIARNLRTLAPGQLAHVQLAILALGDASYTHFCGFAHSVYRELHQRGAQCLTDIIEVDRLDESALRHWQYYLGQLTGQTQFVDWSTPRYQDWILCGRQCANPGSLGAPAFHVRLQPSSEQVAVDTWQAGDIAEIGPCNTPGAITDFVQRLARTDIAPELLLTRDLRIDDDQVVLLQPLAINDVLAHLPELPHREYSIASVPAEGSLDLLVRQVRNAQQQLGLGSGWLTEYAPLKSSIRLRIRSNPHFHSPSIATPLILIGNGTGIAGLRSHLAARASAAVASENWLLFGERSLAHDAFFAADLLHWQQSGLLTQLHCVYSRDAIDAGPCYVQDLLPLHREQLRAWINRGAAIYVCGSLHGMAQGVDQALTQIFGAECLESLSENGRYRRDVY